MTDQNQQKDQNSQENNSFPIVNEKNVSTNIVLLRVTFDTFDTFVTSRRVECGWSLFIKGVHVTDVTIVSNVTCNKHLQKEEKSNVLLYFSTAKNQQKVLSLVYFDDTSYKELEALTELSAAVIRVTIKRLSENNQIEKLKKDNLTFITITEKGIESIEEEYAKHLRVNQPKEVLTIGELDENELYERIKRFIYHAYMDVMLNKPLGQDYIDIDFIVLTKWDPAIGYSLLDNAEITQRIFKYCLIEYDLITKDEKFMVRFSNIPRSLFKNLGDLGVSDLGKLIIIEGDIKQKTDRNPKIVSITFECPNCGNVLEVAQLEEKRIEPAKCGCGRKGQFDAKFIERRDRQVILIAEPLDMITDNRQPRQRYVEFYDSLTTPMEDKKTNPGSRIILIALVKERVKLLRGGAKSTESELILEANNFMNIDKSFYDFTFSEEDIKLIIEYSKKDDLIDDMSSKIFIEHYGDDEIKRAILLQLAGCSSPFKDKRFRDKIHILMVGDPGLDKTGLIKTACKFNPKSRISVGVTSSGVGLTASVQKDEVLGEWTVTGGLLPSAHNGMAGIDELDKASEDDLNYLHEVMEDGTISIAKAKINTTIPASCDMLCGANPKWGRFDMSSSSIFEQIQLKPTLINRFDLIFILSDEVNKEKDTMIATTMLNDQRQTSIDEFNDFLRKYIAYSKKHIHPELNDKVRSYIKSYYTDIRGTGSDNKNIPINPRQLNTIIRLSGASARLRLSNKIEKLDVDVATNLITSFLNKFGLDPMTGEVDVSLMEGGISKSKLGIMSQVSHQINQMAGMKNEKIDTEDLFNSTDKLGYNREEVQAVIDNLKKTGEIYESKKGFIRKL